VVTISTPGGRLPCSSASLALTAAIVSCAFLPERRITTPPATSPSPSSSAMPRRISGPIWMVATSPSRTGTPPRAVQRNHPEVVERLQIAAGADHVLGLGQFQHRAAGFLVGRWIASRTCRWVMP
jgi:hypothetical protein